ARTRVARFDASPRRRRARTSVVDRLDTRAPTFDHHHARDLFVGRANHELPAHTPAVRVMIPPAHVVRPGAGPGAPCAAPARKYRARQAGRGDELLAAPRDAHRTAISINHFGGKRRIEHTRRVRRGQRAGPRGIGREHRFTRFAPWHPTHLFNRRAPAL